MTEMILEWKIKSWDNGPWMFNLFASLEACFKKERFFSSWYSLLHCGLSSRALSCLKEPHIFFPPGAALAFGMRGELAFFHSILAGDGIWICCTAAVVSQHSCVPVWGTLPTIECFLGLEPFALGWTVRTTCIFYFFYGMKWVFTWVHPGVSLLKVLWVWGELVVDV